MNNLVTIQGVRGYIDDKGTAWLNLEDVSRGLGFTQTKGSAKYVRWERVNSYLESMGFPHLVGKEFIPENVFYRLGMKGENEAAQQFQIKVADEILPAIRKTGGYITNPQSPEDFIIMQAQLIKEQAQSMKQLKEQVGTVAEELTTVKHRVDNLDLTNIEGTPRQRLNAMIRKYANLNGITYKTAWQEFTKAYNIAYRTNLKRRKTNEEAVLLRRLTMPEYLETSGEIEDAIRVADKMLNQAS